MIYRILADGILIFHFCFVLFAVLGGLLALRWRKALFFHFPAALWAFLVQWFQWICPLTPLEISLRRSGGAAGYEGGFIEHYISLVLYVNAGRWFHVSLALIVLAVNFLVYWYVFSNWRRLK